MRNYMKAMKDEGWDFHKLYDSKVHYIGTHGKFVAVLNLDESPEDAQFFVGKEQWRITPPIPFSQQVLEMRNCTCDRCGTVNPNDSELRLANEYDKICFKCIRDMTKTTK